MTPEGSNDGRPIALLFLCLGNICRSPLAEGIFIHRATARGVADRFRIDSAGTGGWHAGNRPDPRSIAVARKHGVELPGRARKLAADSDGVAFELILAMDRQNAIDAIDAGIPPERVRLMRSFDLTADPASQSDAEVPDPYYGGDGGFDEVYDMLVRACDGLLDALLESSKPADSPTDKPTGSPTGCPTDRPTGA